MPGNIPYPKYVSQQSLTTTLEYNKELLEQYIIWVLE